MSTTLRNLTYVDPVGRRLVPDVGITVEDGAVTSFSQGARSGGIDGRGRYLVPGLMDMHIHLRGSPHQGPTSDTPVPPMNDGAGDRAGLIARLHSFLYCGVTSVTAVSRPSTTPATTPTPSSPSGRMSGRGRSRARASSAAAA